jgi:protocatechuate 3,4-dioxygenase beta subunit
MEKLISALALTVTAVAFAAGPPPTPMPPANVTSIGVIAGTDEAGPRMIISGEVFASDGITPVAGAFVYAYQTDRTGQYHNDSSGVARLHGFAKTDANGRFEFQTIRPAPYPDRGVPAHVHFHIWGAGYPLQWTEELRFADDPLLTDHDRQASRALGRFGNVGRVTRGSDGAQHVTINFRLMKTTNYPAGVRDPRLLVP